MARAYFPEFFARWKRFFFLKEGDEALSEEVVSVQPVMAQLVAQGDDPEPQLVPLQTISNTVSSLKVSLRRDDSDAAVTTRSSNVDDRTVNEDSLSVISNLHAFNGLGWNRLRIPNLVQAANGASGLTIVDAAGVGIFNRIFSIMLTADTAGIITLSDGLPNIHIAVNGNVPLRFEQGWVQNTANTVITATNSGGGAIAAAVTFQTST